MEFSPSLHKQFTGRKANAAVIEKRVREVRHALLEGMRYSEMVKLTKEAWGISPRQVDAYRKRAAEQIAEAERAVIPGELDEYKERFYRIYEKALKDEQFGTAMAALEKMAKMDGLFVDRKTVEGKMEHEHTVKTLPASPEDVAAQREEWKRKLEAAREPAGQLEAGSGGKAPAEATEAVQEAEIIPEGEKEAPGA